MLLLSGCSGDIGECIDADDFGFAKIDVSSRYDPKVIVGEKENQVAPWIDNSLILNGKPLMIMVKNWDFVPDGNFSSTVSAWCPWYGNENHSAKLSGFCERLIECSYDNDQMCINPVITNSPCLMKKGVGLYAYLAQKGDALPNSSVNKMRNPGLTMHIGEPTQGYQIFDVSSGGRVAPAGGVVYNYDGDQSLNSDRLGFVNQRLYFKILDSHYDDNNGQYKVYIKSGVFNGGWDPITWCIKLVKDRLFGSNDPDDPTVERYGIIRAIYQGIVTNSGYVDTIRAMLILFIIFTAISFLLGSIEITQAEMIKRVLKVGIIAALIDPDISWDFFNQYLFIWFYEGTEFIVSILESVAASGPGSSNPLDFFFSHQIFIKLFSLLLTSSYGWIYVTIYLIMLVFIVNVFFEAAVIYMTALIMMGLLICLAPIFIALYLFEATKSFFENWLKQLIGYFVQIVLIYGGILFMTLIIRNQIYNTLGFRVCVNPILNMPGLEQLMQGSKLISQVTGSKTLENVVSLFRFWMPDIKTWSQVKGIKDDLPTIPIPKDHFQTPQDSVLAAGFTNTSPGEGEYCYAYACFGKRYPDLPFLDPQNPYELSIMNDLRTGNFTNFSGLIVVIVCVYLMNIFNSTTVSISRFLSSTSGNLGDSASAGQSAASSMMSTATAPVRNLANKAKQNARSAVHDFFREQKGEYINKPWNKLRDSRINAEALSYSAAGNVVKRAESETGLKHSDIVKYQIDKFNHRDKIAELYKKEGFSLKEAHNLSSKIIDSPSSSHKDLIAKSLGNTEYSKLSLDKQKKIDELASRIAANEDYKKFSADKKNVEKFQQAYFENYKEMSAQGLGKRDDGKSKVLNFLDGIRDNMNTIRQEEQAQRLEKGQKWLTRSDELKSAVTGGLARGADNEIMYNDKQLRTYNEVLAQERLVKEYSEHQKMVNIETTTLGKDFQRPEYLAEVRSKNPELVGHYDDLIQKDIEYSVTLQLSQIKKGDTYMKEKMSDSELMKSIDSLQEAKSRIAQNDRYLTEGVENLTPSSAIELDRRVEYINNSVDSHIQEVSNILVSRGIDYRGKQPEARSYSEMFSQTRSQDSSSDRVSATRNVESHSGTHESSATGRSISSSKDRNESSATGRNITKDRKEDNNGKR
jgi:type IV secretion system protein VirB6